MDNELLFFAVSFDMYLQWIHSSKNIFSKYSVEKNTVEPVYQMNCKGTNFKNCLLYLWYNSIES